MADLEESKTVEASVIYHRRINAKEILIRQNRRRIYIPICRGCRKKTRKKLRIPRTHSKAGRHCKEWKSQRRISRRTRRVSTDISERWRWSPYGLLVHPRWLHLSSSQWTSSSTLCAERRNIPYSTQIHWRDQIYTDWFGRQAWEAYWWLLECRFERTFVRYADRIHDLLYWERNLPRDVCGLERDWQKFEWLQDQIAWGLRYGPKLENQLRIENNRNVQLNNPN